MFVVVLYSTTFSTPQHYSWLVFYSYISVPNIVSVSSDFWSAIVLPHVFVVVHIFYFELSMWNAQETQMSCFENFHKKCSSSHIPYICMYLLTHWSVVHVLYGTKRFDGVKFWTGKSDLEVSYFSVFSLPFKVPMVDKKFFPRENIYYYFLNKSAFKSIFHFRPVFVHPE